MKKIIDTLANNHTLKDEEFCFLIENINLPLYKNECCYLFDQAQKSSIQTFGKKIYVRGLIEFTNYCRNDCYYCGIRKSNTCATRYHLTKDDILECCQEGYDLGLRTFVLQGGEDLSYKPKDIRDIVSAIREGYPDCAITLSIGEHSYEDYKMWFDAGANRFLLRHETADDAHYQILHPDRLTLSHRMQCLHDLKAIGYQTGTGFMIGSPGQTTNTLLKDIRFIESLKPHMIGIGPFLPHKDTPFGEEAPGSLDLTLVVIAILRLMHPKALIPATTALGTITPDGREMGILAGANVVMPNLSPAGVRKKYMLYNNKLSDGAEAAQNLAALNQRFKAIGYSISYSRGDHPLI